MAKLKRDEFDVMVKPDQVSDSDDSVEMTGWDTIDPMDRMPSMNGNDKKKDKKDKKGKDSKGGEGAGSGEGGEGAGSGESSTKDVNSDKGNSGKTHDVKIDPIKSGIGGVLTDEISRQMQKDLGVPYENNAMDKEEIKEKINKGLLEGTIPDEMKGGSKQHGTGKGSLRAALAKIAKPQVDWRKALKKFIGRSARDTEEKLGHRNFIHSGEYIWTDKEKEQGAIKDAICAVDVSGSMSDDNIALILTEIKGMVEAKKVKNTRIVYFHSDVELIVDLKGPGAVKKYTGHKVHSGGTDFTPPLKVMQDAYKKDKLEIALFLTDGYAELNLPKPKFVTKFIWVILDNPAFLPPWGNMCVYVNSDKSGRI